MTKNSNNAIEFVESRSKSFPDLDSTLYSYKLAGNNFGFDVPFIRELNIDEKTFSLDVPTADGNRRDGVGDILRVEGIKTERHYTRPPVHFNHGKEVPLPIARAREIAHDPESYTFRINPAEKTAGCRAYFYTGKEDCDPTLGCKQHQQAEFAEQIFDMCVQDMIGAGSIGYQIISASHLPPDYSSGIPQGMDLETTLLLESSLVILPANMDTVGKSYPVYRWKSLYTPGSYPAFDKIQSLLTGGRICGKPASPYLVKALEPYRAPRKSTVISGWKSMTHPAGCKCSTCTKSQAKSCSCSECSQGHACPCDTHTKSLKDLRNKYRKKPPAPKISGTTSPSTLIARGVLHKPKTKSLIELRKKYLKKDGEEINQPTSPPITSQSEAKQPALPAQYSSKPPEQVKPDYLMLTPSQAAKKATDNAISGGMTREQAQKIAGEVFNYVHQNSTNRGHIFQRELQQAMANGLPEQQAIAQAKQRVSQLTGKSLPSYEQKGLDANKLKILRNKYQKKNEKRMRVLRHGKPTHVVINVSRKDLDRLRQEAVSKGVEVKWLADTGKETKLKLSGSEGVLGGLADAFGKKIKKKKRI